MSAAERLKDDRALQTSNPPGVAFAAAPGMKTNGARLRLMSNDTDDRDTMPPSAPMTLLPPVGTVSTLEEIAVGEQEPVESWEGYNEGKFLHRATAAVINGTDALLKAKQTWDIEAIIQRQRVLFEETVSTKFNVVIQRVDGDMMNLRNEFAAMKLRMAQIEIALGIKTGA